MTKIILLIVIIIFFLPTPLLILATVLNWKRIKTKPLSQNAVKLVRAIISSGMSMCIAITTRPFTFLDKIQPVKKGQNKVPILMVHGLYHNRTAWLLMKQKLNSANYSNTTTWQYNSFTTSYPELILKLRKEIIRLHNENNCKIILVGHSLGGLVISGASNNPEIEKMVSGLITIGTPFRGSVLALIATGHLGRSLHPSSSLFKGNNKILYPTKISKTAIISPTDEMVIPWQNLEPDTQDWKIIRSPALGHVAMLYSRKVAAIVAERISKIQSTNDS